MSAEDPRRFAPAPRIAAKVVVDEAVIINLETGTYYGLPGTGAVVWTLLAAGHTTGEAVTAVADAYGVEVDVAAAPVAAIADAIVGEGLLVESTRDDAEPVDLDDLVARTEFGSAELDRYDDMEELLALDPPTPGVLDVLMPGPDDGIPS